MILGMFNYHSKSRFLVGRSRRSSSSSDNTVVNDRGKSQVDEIMEQVRELNKDYDDSGLAIMYD